KSGVCRHHSRVAPTLDETLKIPAGADMPVDLYDSTFSSPCTQVRMLARHIGAELNLREVNFTKNEHLSPEFFKINPFHKVPTLCDDGFVIY
ncbi:unnamed protein product, partial [Ixodes pacificus]